MLHVREDERRRRFRPEGRGSVVTLLAVLGAIVVLLMVAAGHPRLRAPGLARRR